RKRFRIRHDAAARQARRDIRGEAYRPGDEPSPTTHVDQYYLRMNAMVKFLTYFARIIGLAQIVSGFAIWFGWMRDSSPHVGLGSVLVLIMWVIALFALFLLPRRALPLFTLLWGGLTLWFGMAQTTLLIGPAHWAIRLAHLLVGVSALALLEALGRAMKAHLAARAATALLFCLAIGRSAHAQTPACNDPPVQPITIVKVPGNPFQALPTADGCWVFVSLPTREGGGAGIGVMKRIGGKLTFERVLPVAGNPTGMVLTHDAKTLIVAANQRVIFLDVARLVAGRTDAVLGYLDEPNVMGRVYANITADDAYAFIADERSQTISVIDMAKARATSYKASSVVGKIPTGTAPIALTLSADESLMFATSQRAPASLDWPIACKREGGGLADTALVFPQGAIHVIDVARAKTDAAHAVIHSVPAGCSAVRLVLSPNGERAYVSARNSNALMVFDTRKLRSDPSKALIARVPLGTAPVGVAVVDDGRKIIVTNSNRFAGDASDRQTLNVVDADKLSVIGSIPAGAFPREMRLTSDGRALILTNFGSSTVQMIDVARLPIER
ncbi:MAG TPA: beta-propeller fold lactonase family protein, partial [Gemmatimonadaceae bacterium]